MGDTMLIGHRGQLRRMAKINTPPKPSTAAPPMNPGQGLTSRTGVPGVGAGAEPEKAGPPARGAVPSAAAGRPSPNSDTLRSALLALGCRQVPIADVSCMD